MKRLLLCAVAAALILIGAPLWRGPAFAGGRVALIVGNSQYQHAPQLPNPAKDAEAMAAMFQKAGFDTVTAAYNVSNLEFKRAIRQFQHYAADADIAVVYYAGHGVEIRGTNYLIPVDASLANDDDAEDDSIALDRVIESAEGATRLRVVILDACRDNPFHTTSRPGSVDPSKRRPAPAPAQGLTRGIEPPGGGLGAIQPTDINTLIAYAAKAGSTAEDGATEHSPFTSALLHNLFVQGLDIRLAFGRVRDEVLKETGNRQEPFVYGSLGGGNISLVPATAEAAPAAAATAEDPEKVKTDYTLVERIGTKGAWQVFLTQHPTGFYSDLARQQIAALEAPKVVPAAPAVAEDRQAWDKIKDSTNAEDLRAFAQKYPSSDLAAVAKLRAEAMEQATKQREREEALRREAQALQAQLADAKRQAEDAARQRAAQDAALAKAQQDAQAAEKARQQAAHEAEQKAAEAARQKQLADAALAQQQAAAAAAQEAAAAAAQKADREALAAARQRAEQEAAAAAQKKAAQDTALAKAQQEAQAAEKARQEAALEADRKALAAAKEAALAEAARKQEAACNDEQTRLDALQAAGKAAKDDLTKLAKTMTCERLRPLVTAALDKASAPDVNTPDQVRAAQQQLSRLGCYSDAADGKLNDSTKKAVQLYQNKRGGSTTGDVQISDALVAELKSEPARVCPLICPSGKVAQGDQCVVAEQPKPETAKETAKAEEKEKPSKASKNEDKKTADKKAADKSERQPARQESAARPATQQASSAAPAHAGSPIGVGF